MKRNDNRKNGKTSRALQRRESIILAATMNRNQSLTATKTYSIQLELNWSKWSANHHLPEKLETGVSERRSGDCAATKGGENAETVGWMRRDSERGINQGKQPVFIDHADPVHAAERVSWDSQSVSFNSFSSLLFYCWCLTKSVLLLLLLPGPVESICVHCRTAIVN